METRTIKVKRDAAPEARAILGARVRLKFTERRRWFWQGAEFTVTGPQDVIDAAEQEIRAAEVDLWWLAQW